jgi:hypothetical protein
MTVHSHPSADRKVPMSWPEKVEAAPSAHAVVEVARDFLAQFTPYEIHSLPPPCEPPAKLVDPDDVTAYAFALVRHECAQSDPVQVERKLADFFSHAAHRLAVLARARAESNGALRSA